MGYPAVRQRIDKVTVVDILAEVDRILLREFATPSRFVIAGEVADRQLNRLSGFPAGDVDEEFARIDVARLLDIRSVSRLGRYGCIAGRLEFDVNRFGEIIPVHVIDRVRPE